MSSSTLIPKLQEIVGSQYVLTDPAQTLPFREGYRFGSGNALAVVRPATLLEQWRVLQACVEAGVISPIVGVIGSLQALETIKVLLNIGKTLAGKLLIIDGLHFSVREMNLPKMPSCQVCTASC